MVGLRRGQLYLADAAVALMIVLSMLVIGFTVLTQKAFEIEDSRTITREQLDTITQWDECTMNEKRDCDERLRFHG